ncbi:hypothetical protein LOSG293_120420 [Secundilactobacillus oryzae JCM 18671]|uniref:Integral membrane protein n=1 Tax=Secundilactobacillus oryzae JCM 18671 TaxID=1291743 RepID=A0A081BID7_9LACO|nr:hypothetical protein [Secundilactobacillus oryzae]GAK47805.1 hypothetical protein LOSG293_120420 [Secundilactobacillus oryzae JCM 18671]
MNKKIRVSSMIVMLCLCLGTIIEGLVPNAASSVALTSYRPWVTIISYIGVYTIILWLLTDTGTIKIILTLINIFAVVISLTFAFSGFMSFHGITGVSLMVVGIVGVVIGIYAVLANNKFTTVPHKSSDKTDK